MVNYKSPFFLSGGFNFVSVENLGFLWYKFSVNQNGTGRDEMKLLASDYDGTLNHNGIDDNKRNMISKWQKAGNVFALISGRGPESVLQIYREKKFPCDYLIANNGAIIFTPEGKIISDIRCEGATAFPLLRLLFENGCPFGDVQTAFPCTVHRDTADCEESDDYTLGNVPPIPYFNQISTRLPDFESAAEVTETIRRNFGEILNPLQNGICIDIVRRDMNKAKGLYLLRDYLGIDSDDIITVGDNVNDLDMLREFRSYAMENGVDCVKEIADYVTEGISELIEKEMQ